ncbi:hypothetical protein G6011_09320 [Alternaria panax]|uniref:Uncharacterized protein n=1 Tax=Alternaria panax TaxID=48097 RepID=A0AAD4IAT6_9PLEO|nr:hypothetical protein G6011_09320 [Alternaria panax]
MASFFLVNPDKLERDIRCMNSTILDDLQGLHMIPRLYQTLFYRTREFAATVRNLVDVAPAMWAEAACLLVDWSVNVLRHKEVGLERFLHSQRESLYWILDDALLRICVDQWDPPQSTTPSSSHSTQSRLSSSSPTPKAVPWDMATTPISLALSRARGLMPLWHAQDLEERENWELNCLDPQGQYFDVGWFRRSTKFLHQSTKIHEIWRTLRRWGGGQLPAELADVIMEDVATFEGLPVCDLRTEYLAKRAVNHGAVSYFREDMN